MLDEVKLRKPEFVAGARIRMADGQEWTLPLPGFVLFPKFDAGAITTGTSTSFGREFDALVEAAIRAEGFRNELMAVWAIGAALLRRNYTLADADLSALLEYRQDDEGSEALLAAILGVAMGQAPKGRGTGG